MKGIWSTLAIVALTALAVSGCGGGDDDSDASLTKAQFVSKGNEICSKGNQEIGEAAEEQLPGKDKPSQAEVTEFAESAIVPVVQREIDGIEALSAPSGDEETVEEILVAAQEALDQAKEEPEVLTERGPGPFAKANELATAYGLTACGEG